MLATRIISCLDVDEGRVKKGVQFKELRDAGDPVELARRYNGQGADELTFLDIGASYKSREILIDTVKKVSEEVFIPLTVGGGLHTVEDMRKALRAGADKVALCTAALQRPTLLSKGAQAFGSQCVVLSIDAKRTGKRWCAFTHGGRNNTGVNAVSWAKKGEELGAGEILLNSMDRDGTQEGYDLELTKKVSQAVNIPVIASGGAGTLEQVYEAVAKGKADAVLLASLLHYGDYTIPEIKEYLREKGVCMR
ncbi:MAG: imidazole glycerol phosphate synthase subunit HisF [Euryarchaeota archaeon]|nr:imidazole glycerol phosphate synthase subunit HisF [Euryarchaeota archaeon]